MSQAAHTGTLLLAALLSWSQLGRPVSGGESALALQPYVDPKGNFKVHPPAGWRVTEYPQDPRGKVAFLAASGAELRCAAQLQDWSGFAGLMASARRVEAKLGLEMHIKKVVWNGMEAVERRFVLQRKKFHFVDFMIGKVQHNLAFSAPMGRYEAEAGVAHLSMLSYEPAAKKDASPKAVKAQRLANKIRLAELWAKNGQYELARQCVRDGLAIDPSNERLLSLRKEIREPSRR